MLSSICMAIFCIILDTYAQKLFSQERSEDLQPRMITSSKSETLQSDSLVNAPQFPIPLLGGFNPFQLKNQIASTKEVSSRFEDWLHSLRTTNFFRPISLSSTAGSLLGTIQTYPLTTNLTRLSDFIQSMGDSSPLSELTNYEQEHREQASNNGFMMNTPNSPIMVEKAGKEKTKGDVISSKNIFTSPNMNSRSQVYIANGNITDTTNNYYNPDLAMGKIPEAEENDELRSFKKIFI